MYGSIHICTNITADENSAVLSGISGMSVIKRMHKQCIPDPFFPIFEWARGWSSVARLSPSYTAPL